jgi:hypothetical protein
VFLSTGWNNNYICSTGTKAMINMVWSQGNPVVGYESLSRFRCGCAHRCLLPGLPLCVCSCARFGVPGHAAFPVAGNQGWNLCLPAALQSVYSFSFATSPIVGQGCVPILER